MGSDKDKAQGWKASLPTIVLTGVISAAVIYLMTSMTACPFIASFAMTPTLEKLKSNETTCDDTEMTLKELKNSLVTTGRYLIGCKGKIYDVSSYAGYREEGNYFLYVGHDSSVALAKWSLTKKDLDPRQHWSRDLNEKELVQLDYWEEKYDGKY